MRLFREIRPDRYARGGSGASRRGAGLLGVALLLLAAMPAVAAELAEAQKLFDAGKYAECIAACEKGMPTAVPTTGLAVAPVRTAANDWRALKARAELETGKYEEAVKTGQAGLASDPENLVLTLELRRALRMTGRAEEARALLGKVQNMLTTTPWHFTDPENRVAMGKFMLLQGSDARQVLEGYFDRARRDDPRSLSAMMAIGDLALAKNDPGVAAEAYDSARKVAPENPDAYLGLARANDDDSEMASAALNKALELNPQHIDSLLLLTDNLIDRERYKDAGEALDKVLAVNPTEQRAWAYRAVIAHLLGDHKAEETDRATALSTWKTNPEVDTIIGRKLSQNYRFAEGTAYQNKALAFDASYLPARFQLCQDLLRMGKEEEGWKLADSVFKSDPYNVMAYNLVTLHDRLAKFKTLSNDQFLLRMDAKEAPIYGPRALRLLTKAHEALCAKYGVKLDEPTTVEVFPLQQDFQIRTFGFPGEEGYLGVCFGRVVTVNSPASRLAHPTSWEAVIWHEFCHAVTLTKTQNKMPRWISEGISVYEERQANPAWGDHMLPAYRALIEKNGATKISEMSQAFAMPPSPMHLQFAYFEASMVVQYVVDRFGMEALKGVLTDLGNDVLINEALAKHVEPMEKLDQDFATWFKGQADQLAPKVNWEEPKLSPEDGSGPLTAWNKAHPDSFVGLIYEGEALLMERKWEEAKTPLKRALEIYPGAGQEDGPYPLLAKAYQELKETEAEREMLTKYVALNADAVAPRMRLIELATAAKDWKVVREQAQAVLGVDPLTAAPYRSLAEAAEALGDRATAIEARRTVLLMDPLDKPEQHYRLAKVLFDDGQLAEARREVVLCLENAPRYRQGLSLLLDIAAKMDAAAAESASQSEPAPATAPASAPIQIGVPQEQPQ
jgi:tetratricopeptide (TPR) repeat protein